MALPPLYKYLDVRGAKLTLGNRTFKFAKPSDFNDVEDLTIQSIFPEDTEAALERLTNGFVDVIVQHLDCQPTSPSFEKRAMIALMQDAFKRDPDAIEMVKSELGRKGFDSVFNVEYMRQMSETFIDTINGMLQSFRVLCVTTHKCSEEMWNEYAEGHKGIALRIMPSIEKDSKFQLFKPVEYRERRPPLYDDALDMLGGSLFGDHEDRIRAILDKIIYSKTLRWQHESEFRLAIPLADGEQPWNTLLYHPEEIIELYLGHAMTEEDRSEIVTMARAVNPEVSILCATRSEDGELVFNPI